MTAGIWAVLLLVIPAAVGLAWWRRRLEEERHLEGEAGSDDMTFGTQLLLRGFLLTAVVLVLLGVAFVLLLLLFR